jgi:N utilization substance protein B
VKRIHAREIAVQLMFAIAISGADAQDAVDLLFEPEYFASLGSEDGLEALFRTPPDEAQLSYITYIVAGAAEHMPELNDYIERYSQGWSVGRISNIALAVLRVAMYEVIYFPEVPPRSALDAAIEILKGYEEERTVKFVNGVLGSFVRTEMPDAT